MSSRCTIAFAFLVSLTGCVVDAVDHAEQGVEPVAEEAQAFVASPVASYSATGGDALLDTNGKKIVIAGGRVHAVWAVGGVVKYSSSADGVSWDAPFNVDSSASRTPTIAASSDGRIGIAYIKNYGTTNGEVYYRSLIGYPASWSTPVRVVSNYQGVGNTPSMAASGTTMYLAWANGWIYHAAFNANLTASLPTGEIVSAGTGCATLTASHPSIAVSGSTVRIAQFEDEVGDPWCPSPAITRIRLSERGAGTWSTWYDFATSSAVSHNSLSMDANAGTFYIASSSGSGLSASTDMYRVSGSLSSPSFAQQNLTTYQTYVSVAAKTQDCQNKVRVMWSRRIAYQTTSYRTATWGGVAPSWIEGAPVTLSAAGRAGTAMLNTLNLANTNQTRYFYGLFDETTGGSNFILKDAYDTVTTPAPCE